MSKRSKDDEPPASSETEDVDDLWDSLDFGGPPTKIPEAAEAEALKRAAADAKPSEPSARQEDIDTARPEFDPLALSYADAVRKRPRSDRTRTQPEPVVQRQVERMVSNAPGAELAFEDMSAEPGSAMDLVESGLEPPPDPMRGDARATRAQAEIQDRYAVGDFTGALVIAESVLEADPDNEEALRYAATCREVLTQMYAARLGPLSQVVTVAVPADQVTWLSLDHRAGFLLSLVDGSSTIDEILDISGMTRLEALRIMYTLVQQNVVALS